MNAHPLSGKRVVVTGATGGLASGIAAELVQAGATVYLTGRSQPKLDSLAARLDDPVGVAVPIVCDHADDDAVSAAFDRIVADGGRIDVLVNCVASVPHTVQEYAASFQPFWQTGPEIWDVWCNVGLRSHYVASIYAARRMVEQRSGLIVNVSAAAAANYFQSVAYGVGKAALDRFTADAAIQLAEHNVSVVSIWPGAIRTDLTEALEQAGAVSLADAESGQFSGRAIVALATDPAIHERTGRAAYVAQLAREYGFTELDGTQPDLPTYGGILTHERSR